MTNTGDTKTIRCLRCRRVLRSRKSQALQYGPGCRAKIRAAAIAEAVKGFAERQIEKARELIADGGLIPTSRPGIFQAVSSKGDATYLVSVKGICGCAGGRHGTAVDRCYHAAAARVLAASGKAA
jgi:RNA 3'-terminal phosphate cyclase